MTANVPAIILGIQILLTVRGRHVETVVQSGVVSNATDVTRRQHDEWRMRKDWGKGCYKCQIRNYSNNLCNADNSRHS